MRPTGVWAICDLLIGGPARCKVPHAVADSGRGLGPGQQPPGLLGPPRPSWRLSPTDPTTVVVMVVMVVVVVVVVVVVGRGEGEGGRGEVGGGGEEGRDFCT